MVAKRRPKSKNYFTAETEKYIIEYNRLDPTEHEVERSRIYEKHIHHPFFKLTQNIIHTFKFYHTEVENLEHLQHEIITFLLSKIDFYHHGKSVDDRLFKIIHKEFGEVFKKGSFLDYVNSSDTVTQDEINTFISSLSINSKDCKEKINKITPPKAYSYFGTIVKRWLILYNTKNYSKKINNTGVEELSKDGTTHFYSMGDDQVKSDLDKYVDIYVEYVGENIYTLFPKKNDAQVADAILELFRKREDLEVFNKKALYIYIREMIDVKTPKITKIANKLYDIFKSNYVFYLEYGYTKF